MGAAIAIVGLGASIYFGVKGVQMANEQADMAKKNAKEQKFLQNEAAKAQLLRAVLQPGAKTMADVIHARRNTAAAQQRERHMESATGHATATLRTGPSYGRTTS